MLATAQSSGPAQSLQPGSWNMIPDLKVRRKNNSMWSLCGVLQGEKSPAPWGTQRWLHLPLGISSTARLHNLWWLILCNPTLEMKRGIVHKFNSLCSQEYEIHWSKVMFVWAALPCLWSLWNCSLEKLFFYCMQQAVLPSWCFLQGSGS